MKGTTFPLVVLALVLAACGADDTADDVAAVEEEAAATAEPDFDDAEEVDEAEEAEEVEEAAADEDESDADDAEAGDGDEALAIGETSAVGDYEVTVTGFVADATEEVLDFNPFNDPPGNGVYATVTFDVVYLGEGESNPGMDLTAALVIDAVQHADYECLAVVENDAIVEAPTLEQGGQASDLAFCFDHPGVDDDTRFFMEETISLDDERTYWAVLD